MSVVARSTAGGGLAYGREGGAAGGSSPTEKPTAASPVTEDQKRELREAFELFDPEGSGLIDVSDLKITVRAVNWGEKVKIVSRFSEEGSGKLTFKSFLQAEPCLEKEILEAVEVFDCDGTGEIFENQKVMASEVGEDIMDEELQEMTDEADVDGDEDVEFLWILTLTDP